MGCAEDAGKRTTALAAERSCAGAAHAAAALSTPWCEALLIQCSITMLPLTQIAEPLGVSDILCGLCALKHLVKRTIWSQSAAQGAPGDCDWPNGCACVCRGGPCVSGGCQASSFAFGGAQVAASMQAYLLLPAGPRYVCLPAAPHWFDESAKHAAARQHFVPFDAKFT